MKIIRIMISICFTFLPISTALAQMNTMAVTPEGGKVAQDPSLIAAASQSSTHLDQSNEDHLARIFDFKGEVKILKRNAQDWVPAQKEMIIEAGDQILTGKDAYMDVVYDAHFLNISRIEAQTKAEFRTIEPTDLHLEDGMIFNALDGLMGQKYQVSTPTAVAAVRGTTFDVGFDMDTKITTAFVFPDQSPHVGEIAFESLNNQGSSQVLIEGQKIEEGSPITSIPEPELAKGQDNLNQLTGNEQVATLRAE